jgi:hypothetical protein
MWVDQKMWVDGCGEHLQALTVYKPKREQESPLSKKAAC